MQEANVGCGIFALRLTEFRIAPVTGLLLLRNILTEKLAHQFLQSVAVRIGADQPRRDFRAENRLCHHTHIMFDGGKIKTREMIEFQTVPVGEDGAQVGRRIVAFGTKADKMLVAVAVRYLQQAQAVPMRLQPHGFRIHCDRCVRQSALGNIFLMKKNCHHYLPVYIIGGPTSFSQPLHRHDSFPAVVGTLAGMPPAKIDSSTSSDMLCAAGRLKQQV